MKILTSIRLVAAATLLCLAPALWAQSSVGNIRAVQVSGTVTVQLPTGQGAGHTAVLPLTEGQVLNQGAIIRTGADGRVRLLFSNGSAISLWPASELAVDVFLQDSHRSDLREGTAEPSKSRINLRLNAGELVSNVRKLQADSEYSIRTPLGAAGVRGTTFGLSFNRPSSNTGRSQLRVAHGLVEWLGAAPGQSPRGVKEGQKANATGQFDANGNLISSTYLEEVKPDDLEFLNRLKNEGADLDALFKTNPPPPAVPTTATQVPGEDEGGTPPMTTTEPPVSGQSRGQ